jgi:ubiquinone biosynthesis protein Coq4
MRLRYTLRAFAAFRDGRNGDAAAYKAAAANIRPNPELARRLAALATPYPALDADYMRACPEGSFGRAYVQFMDAHGFKPLAVSPQTAAELGGAHVLGIRYTLLHDAFHVLLGFPGGLPGELGVWTFVARQGYSATYDTPARMAALLYPILAPRQHAQLRHARTEGERLAREAACLIAVPLETYLEKPLADVRNELGIRPAQL